jgi:D-Tyr-tRNAtyr deacylase
MPLEVQHTTNKEENNMEIIKKSEGLTSADLYSLTKGSDVRKMADAKGEILEISKFVLYQDTDVNGEPMQVLSVETAQGVRYATNSKTFVRNFNDILDIFEISGEPLPTKFKVGSGKSKSNREYLTCDIAK